MKVKNIIAIAAGSFAGGYYVARKFGDNIQEFINRTSEKVMEKFEGEVSEEQQTTETCTCEQKKDEFPETK